MKINKYVEDLRTKSAAELNEELVAESKKFAETLQESSPLLQRKLNNQR